MTDCSFILKTSDASANPYLALGAVIFAGLDGIGRNLNPGDPVDIDPGLFSEAELTERGIARLPQNLGEAIEHLRGDRLGASHICRSICMGEALG